MVHVRRRSRLSVFIVTISVAMVFVSGAAAQRRPLKRTKQLRNPEATMSNGLGAFATGNYRNLFEEAGHTEKHISAKVDAAFQQLFYGDSATQAVYYPAGKNSNGPLAYVSDVYHNDIRSEGMSYGMMICVQLDRKAEFDALWNYAVSHMYEPRDEHPSQGYFHWSLKRNGAPNAETPAPDGEEYFVMALYFASGRWGNGEGIYNYKAWADKVLTAMRHHPVKLGDTKLGLKKVQAMVNEDYKMIRFVPNIDQGDFTDPSYHLPAFYELWARWGPKVDRNYWATAADTSRNFFLRAANSRTGLCSDYANFDGSPYPVKWNANASNFSYDSWRTASNWSVDWSWWHKDVREQELSNRIQKFFASKGINTYGSRFTPDGREMDSKHRTGLVATNAVASLASTHKLAPRFVDELWKAPIPSAFGERYYDGLLYMISLLHCSGTFRIYTPK